MRMSEGDNWQENRSGALETAAAQKAVAVSATGQESTTCVPPTCSALHASPYPHLLSDESRNSHRGLRQIGEKEKAPPPPPQW